MNAAIVNVLYCVFCVIDAIDLFAARRVKYFLV